MKTILFIDKADREIWDSYQRYDYLLAEYEKTDAFMVCEWNKTGMSVRTAIPQLFSLVSEGEEWRAVIVTDLSDKDLLPEEDAHFDNPFDFSENYENRELGIIVESERPIIRLAQMLGGVPDRPLVVWPDDIDVSDKESLEDLEDVPKLENPVCAVNDVDIVVSHRSEQYDMLRRYRLGIDRPSSIICITPRDRDEDMVSARVADLAAENRAQAAEEVHLIAKANREHLNREEARSLEVKVSLGFWERNGYPPQMRFIVCDRMANALPEGASEDLLSERVESSVKHRDDWFQFWLSVLSLIVADAAPEYLRPFVLHSLEVNVDDQALIEAFSRKFSEWAAVMERIEDELEQERRKTHIPDTMMRKLPDCRVNIGVVFESIDPESLQVDTSLVGLFKDNPELDRIVWKKQKIAAEDAFRNLLRAPVRSMFISAAHFRQTSTLPEHQIEDCIMNACQCEELKDEIHLAEYGLAQDTAPPSFEVDTYEARIQECSKEIDRQIERRTTKGQAFLAIGFAMLALLFGLAPGCFTSDDVKTSVLMLLVCVGACIVLGVVGFATLHGMRRDVRQAYKAFNGTMAQILNELHSQAQRLGRRLSSFASLKRQWSLLNRQDHKDEVTQRAQKLGANAAIIRNRMTELRAIEPEVHMVADLYSDIMHSDWETCENLIDEATFFSLECPEAQRSKFNEGLPTECEIRVPYSFISSVNLTPIKVYEG